MPAGVQANWYVSPVHVQCFSCWNWEQTTLIALWWCHDYLAHILGKGYKRKTHKRLRSVVWIFGTEWLGQLLRSHQPSSSAISVPLMEQEYILDELCALFIYLLVLRHLWDPFSWYGFSCLAVSQVAHYLHPLEPSIGQGMDHKLCSRLHRWDKLLLWCESPPIHLASLCALSHMCVCMSMHYYIYTK